MQFTARTCGAHHEMEAGYSRERTVVRFDGRFPVHIGALYVIATVTDLDEADAVERFLEERRLAKENVK